MKGDERRVEAGGRNELPKLKRSNGLRDWAWQFGGIELSIEEPGRRKRTRTRKVVVRVGHVPG